MARKQVIDLHFIKRGMETMLKIKVAPEIEKFFRDAASKPGATLRRDDGEATRAATQESNKWVDENGRGLVFYTKNVKLSDKVSHFGAVIDNFGNGLLDDDRINLALLRIVGASQGDGKTVKTSDLLGVEEMKQYVEGLANWTKAFYENHLKDQDLSATITFEV